MKLLRSPRELLFRLRQHLWNAWALLHPPQPPATRFPDPEGAGLPPDLFAILAGADTAGTEAVEQAARLLNGEYEILGRTLTLASPPDWNLDPLHRKSSTATYSPAIPYLDFQRTGDHKFVWEVNRHQHLLVLARAYAVTRDGRYLSELSLQLDSWLTANPLLRGVNWTSALEAALRSLSWLLIWQMTGAELQPSLRDRLRTALFQSACFIERNLSTYFSPNTHLLAEAAVLRALGAFFAESLRSEEWIRLARQAILDEIGRQVSEDGAYKEHSPWYHLFATDILSFYWILEGRPPGVLAGQLERMRGYLAALCGSSGRVPRIGDDDGGRLVYPYGRRLHSIDAGESAPLASRRPDKAPRLFLSTGMAVLESGGLQVLFGTGAAGSAPSAHHHCDALAVVVRFHGEELLTDSGTLTYSSSRLLRDACRLSTAHSTVALTRHAAAATASQFSWKELPRTESFQLRDGRDGACVTATVRYAGVTHRRTVKLEESGKLQIEDDLELAPGPAPIQQCWISPLPLDCAGGAIRFGASGLMLRLAEVQPAGISLTRMRGASSYAKPCLLYRATRFWKPSRAFHLLASLEPEGA